MTHRRTPESYLSQADAEEKRAQQGALKIYLGAAPGVGKTYQMLSDALVKRSQGIDVVIGIVETHGRQEVESLASAFEKIPCCWFQKENIRIRTLDLDAIYKRAPGLLLVDEAAYSNPDGTLHPKRWQDILDIVARGINVYTTLNIQHLESLNDVVGRLIGIPVHETIPDAFLEQASVIELIDLPSEELIARLKEGKVYLPSEVSVAIHHFFKKSNLDALRELALRIAAERVSSEVESDYSKNLSARLLYQEDCLLVCVNHDLDMSRLIRAAKRIASRLNCPWHALFIDTGNAKDFCTVQSHLQFAQSLGAKTHIVFSSHVTKGIEDFIEEQKITQIVLGKTRVRPWPFQSSFDKLIEHLKDVGVYRIELKSKKNPFLTRLRQMISVRSILGLGLVLITAALMVIFKNIFSPWDFGWLTGLFILLIAYWGAWRFVWLLMFLFLGLDLLFNARSFDYLMTDKWAWFQQYGSWSLLFLCLSGFLIHAKRQILLAREIENSHGQLIAFYQSISHVRGVQPILIKIDAYLKKYFNIDLRVFLPHQGTLQQVFPVEGIFLDEKELGVVQWVFESGQEAGIGTGNLIFSNAYYLPIKTHERSLGVVQLSSDDSHQLESHKKTLIVLMQQLSMILELEIQQQQQVLQEKNDLKFQVRDDILKKFSEQFYQPFAEMTQKLSETMSNPAELKQLLRLKNHLKVVHYLSFEKNKAKRGFQNIVKIIEQVLRDNQETWVHKKIIWKIDKNLPEIKVHYDLIYILIDNLLDNIALHANPQEGIEIDISQDEDNVFVSFADDGPGFSEKELQKIFESFYQGQQAQNTGLGLGFALCERIIDWHQGKIWAKNRLPKGAIFSFILPKNIKEG